MKTEAQARQPLLCIVHLHVRGSCRSSLFVYWPQNFHQMQQDTLNKMESYTDKVPHACVISITMTKLVCANKVRCAISLRPWSLSLAQNRRPSILHHL